MTKNTGKAKLFLGIEVVYQKNGLVLSLRKYALDLLQTTGLLGCKYVSKRMKTDVDFWNEDSKVYDDIK